MRSDARIKLEAGLRAWREYGQEIGAAGIVAAAGFMSALAAFRSLRISRGHRRAGRDRRHRAAAQRKAPGRADEHPGLQPGKSRSTGRELDRRPHACVARRHLPAQRHELERQLQRRGLRYLHPRHRLDRGHLDHRDLRRRHADPDPSPQLRYRQPLSGPVRPRPRRGSEGTAGHAVRRGLRGRHRPLHHAGAEPDHLLGLRPRGVRQDRQRRQQLRGRRRIRRARSSTACSAFASAPRSGRTAAG